MPVFASLSLALAHPPLWCPPPRPIVMAPPIVWVECPPGMAPARAPAGIPGPAPAKVPDKTPARAPDKALEKAPVRPAVPEIKPDEPKSSPVPKVESPPVTPIKPVTNVTPMSPGSLPRLDTPPQPPKPAPKIELDLPTIPPAKDIIIPKPVDLPAIPPALPPSTSGYRPHVDIVRFPANTDITNVTLFNLTATETTVTISGRAVTLPARTKQRVDVTGDVWWQIHSAERRIAERGGELEIYLNGK